MKNVLIIGTDSEITRLINRLVNDFEGFNGEAVNSIDELLLKLSHTQFDILLIGGGFTSEQEIKIREIASSRISDLKVIEHYGGGSGLLLEELNRE